MESLKGSFIFLKSQILRNSVYNIYKHNSYTSENIWVWEHFYIINGIDKVNTRYKHTLYKFIKFKLLKEL